VNGDTLRLLLVGATAMAWFVAGLFFLRYWRSTHDRFFLLFALAFWIEAANRVDLGLSRSWSEASPLHYSIRLVAYLLILYAIWHKNRPGGR
jgi:hypothetical protein